MWNAHRAPGEGVNGDARGPRELLPGRAARRAPRGGGVPVKLPLEDRSLTMSPQNSRWNYKKEIMGQEAYAEALANQKKE